MQILGFTRRIGDSAEDEASRQALVLEEVRAAWALQSEGVIRNAWRVPEKKAVALLLEAGSIAEAEAFLARLPMVRDGLLDFDLMRLEPYTSYSMLFAKEEG